MAATENSTIANLWSRIEFNISKYGDAVAQIDAESKEPITYKEIFSSTVSCSTRLNEIGIKKGDVVALISNNSINFIWQLMGCVRIGATCALISAHLKSGELRHVLGICEPSAIIAPELNKEQSECILSLDVKAKVFTKEDFSHLRRFPMNDLVNKKNSVPYVETAFVRLDEPAMILFSSGSTGFPKGVTITHRNLITSVEQSESIMPVNGATLGLMPFCHAYGLGVMLMALYKKNPVIVMPKFSMDNFLHTLKIYQVVNLFIVPSLVVSLSKLEDSKMSNLASIRHLVTAAGTISPCLLKNVRAKLHPATKISHCFGMTECTFIITEGEWNENSPASTGRVISELSAKIVDEQGNEVEPGQPGELMIRGPMVMRGYYRNDKATRDAINCEGWLRSGDVAYIDTDGCLVIVDRMKEMIKYQGHQIAPSELEMTVAQIEQVMDVAVVGVPHEVYGEVPRAYVVKQPDSDLTEEDIQQIVYRELSSFKQLRGGVKFVKELPKSPGGKLLRSKLGSL